MAEAIAIFQVLLADKEQIFGAEYPGTLATRHELARAYHAAGRVAEAIAIFQELLADCERVLSPAHPGTLAAREALADAYQAARTVS